MQQDPKQQEKGMREGLEKKTKSGQHPQREEVGKEH
jgi:hypothetical protein